MNPVCVCQHEAHDGRCPELVIGFNGTMPCGCDDYCPDHEVEELISSRVSQ